MSIYEFLIAVKDEEGKKRKKRGDIIDIKSYPHSWGSKELSSFLIILVELNSSRSNLSRYVKGSNDVKRNYAIDIDKLIALTQDTVKCDANKILNVSFNYQPFKKLSHLIEKLPGLKVDAGIASEEFILSAENFQSILITK